MDQLEQLRYPTGRRMIPEKVTAAHRTTWIESIARTPAALQSAVSGMTSQQLDTPYRPGGWTVRQVIHHLPDSHINAYTRFRWALTEDNPLIKTYKETKWAELPDARYSDIEFSLKLLEAVHSRWVFLLNELGEDDFARSIVHPEDGPMSLNDLLATYAWHGPHHIAHITSLRIRRGW